MILLLLPASILSSGLFFYHLSDHMTSTNQIRPRHYRTSGRRTLRSTSLANISLGCAIRRSVRLALARYFWQIVVLMLLITASAYARYAISSSRQTETRAKQLASFALDRLAHQAVLHAQDPDYVPDTYISMSQLRDDVLRDEFSARRRQRLWTKVQKKVEANSNVRSAVREGRSGEVSRVWEWVGAIGGVDDVRTPGRRESARFNLPSGDSDRSPPATFLSVKHERSTSPPINRFWDDARPAY